MFFNSKPYTIVTNRFIAVLGCVLLLISSCTVRNTIADIIDIEAVKPVSPAKTTGTGLSSCIFLSETVVTSKEQDEIIASRLKNDGSYYLPLVNETIYSAGSPALNFRYVPKIPKYILFKNIKSFIS